MAVDRAMRNKLDSEKLITLSLEYAQLAKAKSPERGMNDPFLNGDPNLFTRALIKKRMELIEQEQAEIINRYRDNDNEN